MTVILNHKLKAVIKQLICIVLIVGLLVVSVPYQVTFANKFAEFETVELIDQMTGTSGLYEPVNIMIKGEDIFSDAPGIIIGGRSLVPISAILKELGIQYSWNAQTQEILFSTQQKSVVMQINNATATVNGKKITLPDGVAPKIMTYKSISGEAISRTYVPLKFVSEMLDLSASWIDATRTVAINEKPQSLTGMRFSMPTGYPEIRLKMTGEAKITSFVVEGTEIGGQDKLVVEFQNTQLKPPSNVKMTNQTWTQKLTKESFSKYLLEDPQIEKVELTQSSNNPYTTRLTVYQDAKRGHDIFYDAKTKEWVVQFVNVMNEVKMEEIYSTNTIVIDTSETPTYNVDINNQQITIDVLNCNLKANNGAFQVLPISNGKIEAVAYQQLNTANSDLYDPSMDVTRVIIELNKKVSYEDFYVEARGSQVLVYVTDEAIYNFDYVKQSDDKSRMTVKLESAFTYEPTFNKSTRQLTVEIPKTKVALGAFVQEVNDNIVEKMTVTEKANTYQIDIILGENTSYKKIVSTNEIKLEFTNTVIQNSEHKQTLIVIDAGHGGKDPGAIGTKGQEKNMALKAALMLESELKSLGFKVYMTRSTDEYVNLYDRATMANNLDATLFVSIHINAFTNSATSGVEVLYGDESMTSDKGLAKSIQTELVKGLGAFDRGIASLPRLVVLRETKMTSVLCELGFITNPDEQDKLLDDQYLLKAAQAMARGIVSFMK